MNQIKVNFPAIDLADNKKHDSKFKLQRKQPRQKLKKQSQPFEKKINQERV